MAEPGVVCLIFADFFNYVYFICNVDMYICAHIYVMCMYNSNYMEVKLPEKSTSKSLMKLFYCDYKKHSHIHFTNPV